jgi:hypothetical protein
MRRSLVLAVVMSALLLACSPSGVKQAEYDQLASELAAAKQQVVDLQSKLGATEQQAASTQFRLDELQQEHDAAAKAAAWGQDFKAAYEALDALKLPTFYAEDCQYMDPEYACRGRDCIRSMAEGLKNNGDRIEIKSFFSGTDWAALEAVWFTSVEGKQRAVPYAGIYRLKDGLISQEHLYWDDMLMLR